MKYSALHAESFILVPLSLADYTYTIDLPYRDTIAGNLCCTPYEKLAKNQHGQLRETIVSTLSEHATIL